jgi:CRISPR-associated protein Cst2
MSIHVFGTIITPHGIAANNRGETDGNITRLQKLVCNGQILTTVSAEAIKFAARRQFSEHEECNRNFDGHVNTWKDREFTRWEADSKDIPFIDDDLLGFMSAEAAKSEGQDEEQDVKGKGKGKRKGTIKNRRGMLDMTRAASATPWVGGCTFNAASPGATPSAQKKGENPTPYGTEMHATRYQYGFAMTPDSLYLPKRAETALRVLCSLGAVAGNNGRFLFDFSPESIVIRITQDPAPRIFNAFKSSIDGVVTIQNLVRKVKVGDVKAHELIIGGDVTDVLTDDDKEILKLSTITGGIIAACQAAIDKLAKG